jgi:hypothetical protein
MAIKKVLKMQNITGTWRLKSFHMTDMNSGEVKYPYGEQATGQVTYAASGAFGLCLVRGNRKNFLNPDPGLRTDAESQAIGEDFFSYFGRYDYVGHKVEHHIDQCTIPNWEGETKTRFVNVTGDVLTLSTAPFDYEGASIKAEVVWQKA